MYSPDGFTSLYQVAEDYRKAGIGMEQFIVQCSQIKAVAVCAPSKQPINISTDLLHVVSWNGSDVFAFIDMSSWAVSLDLVREAAGSFTPELFAGSRILLNTDPNGDFDFPFPPEFAEGLVQFEGQQIIIKDTEADRLQIALKSTLPNATVKRFSTKVETKQAFKAWIASNPYSTDKQRNQWYADHGLSRESGRDLWRELKPQGGSKGGPKPKTN